ncbi:class A beta-lactamase [Epibacterium sp. SM1969]|uniref:beta-lactamase n=1 Tax=Tritonibacter aquimaris TaxID=2663379 RepID=A0A844APX3_9RHOB|nr:class A beta-lactamase [Tritonibacter aquimaris]MQY41547.1 class A beta-lactamase [Tritonibacter aquimaris]
MRLRILAAGLGLALSCFSAATAQTSFDPLSQTISAIETRLDARVGVALIHSDHSWFHRPDTPVLLTSTAKTLICATVLAQNDQGLLSLDEHVPILQDDLLSYAPVSTRHVGGSLSIGDLCLATLDLSDNTAANLLLQRLNGPETVTAFLRSLGDEVSRLDRMEPALNSPSEDLDTTTPRAMVETLSAIFFSDLLSQDARQQLRSWMGKGGVTQNLLREAAPKSWKIWDKSGAGKDSRSLIAVIAPPKGSPWIAAIYISEAEVDFQTRNAALRELSAAVVAVLSQ